MIGQIFHKMSEFPDLKLIAQGKVRNIYELTTTKLLFVATDRVSAFDAILETPLPGNLCL